MTSPSSLSWRRAANLGAARNWKWHHFVLCVGLLVIGDGWSTTPGTFAATQAAPPTRPWAVEWTSTWQAPRPPGLPPAANSQHVAVDRQGRLHVLHVERTPDGTHEQLIHTLHTFPPQREIVTSFMHHGQTATILQAFSLALDARDQPHAYWYAVERANEREPYREQWAVRTSAAGRWQVSDVRRDGPALGGAALGDPHLAIDLQGDFHLTGYVHNAYGEIHRARHRTSAGGRFPIVPLPEPTSFTDSSRSNLCIDAQGQVHVVYSVSKALGNGLAERGYPSTALTYARWQQGTWSPPVILEQSVGANRDDTTAYIHSIGLAVSKTGEIDVVYAAGTGRQNAPLWLRHWRGRPYDPRVRWNHSTIIDWSADEAPAPAIDVWNPVRLADDALVVVFSRAEQTSVALQRRQGWATSVVSGRGEGFAVWPSTDTTAARRPLRLWVLTRSNQETALQYGRGEF